MQRINYETGETWDDGLPEEGYYNTDQFPMSSSENSPVMITNKPDVAASYGGVSRLITPQDSDLYSNEMRTGIQPNGTPWASNVPGWEPPPPKPDLMPKLYNEQKAEADRPTIPGPPPGQPGFEETTRAKFIQHAINEIGFDPLTLDPAAEARREESQFYKRMDDPTSKEATEYREGGFRQSSMRGFEVGGPQYQTGARTRELQDKKDMGMKQLAFMVQQFDKDMEWKSIGAGGLFQPGTGETISPFRGPKTPNETELITSSLRDTSGKEPTAAEVLKAKQDRDLEKAKANRAILGNPAGAQAFPVWPEEDKQMAYQTKMLTGKNPTFSSRDSESRAGFEKGYNAFINSKGFSASDIALMQADYRAGNMSLGNMTKQEAPMNAFVLNINKQITKLETLYSNNDRVGIRLLDLPLRELKVKAKGSGLEASRASYLLEISNEIGKLSSGASASVQQLSDSAKEDWKKVHDPNLSLKELMVVLNATRDQANMRMTTWREAKEEVRASLKGLGGNQTPPPSKPRLTPAEAIEELRRRGRI